jgi:DNA-directed RNA polymerase sigma subunit (sigma70/sigma32)
MKMTAIAEQPDSELYTTEQPTPATNNGNYAPNICMVSKREASVDRFHPREHAARNGDTATKLYLCEIGQVEQLTPEDEIGLVARTKRGDRKARERLIKGNLRRVVKISRKFENNGLPLLDLISEGNIGLIKAVERFEPTKGNKFSTFSAWWIKQSIKRALANQFKTIPRQLDNGNQAGLLRFPVEGARSSRSRPANIRLLNVIRHMQF